MATNHSPLPNHPNLILNFCKSPTKAVFDEICQIVAFRTISPYQEDKFRDLMVQIDNRLDSIGKDCSSNLALLHLLKDLIPLAKQDVTQVWNRRPARLQNFKHYFAHTFSFDVTFCDKCESIKKMYLFLDGIINPVGRVTRQTPAAAKVDVTTYEATSSSPSSHKVKENAVICATKKCKSQNIQVLLPCEHYLCEDCTNKNAKEAEKNKHRQFFCPADKRPVNIDYLKEHGWEESAVEKATLAQDQGNGASGSDSNLIQCPKCKSYVLHYPINGMLADCMPCNFCFCSNCLQDFHGFTDCETKPEVAIQEKEQLKVYIPKVGNSKLPSGNTETYPEQESSYRNGSVPRNEYNRRENNAHSHHRGPEVHDSKFNGKMKPITRSKVKQAGADAEQYELDFYTNLAQSNTFTLDEISHAFVNPTSEGIYPEKWSWEFLNYNNRLNFPPPFASLSAGNWVEDEILEDAIKIIIQKKRLENEVAFLESYVMNWSMRKDYGEDNELLRIIKGKQLQTKSTILALINTDLNGVGGHWIVGCVHVPTKSIFLFDSSLISSGTFYQKFFFGLMHILHIAHCQEDIEEFDQRWKLVVSLDSVQQENDYDCGPVAVCNAYAILTKNAQLDKLPKSYAVREWLFCTLSFDDSGDMKKPGKISGETANSVTNETPRIVKPYKPSGLQVRYQYLKNVLLFGDISTRMHKTTL